jgi:L-ascorbate metabolism protein UlaG (beta-lactamase superfamily)
MASEVLRLVHGINLEPVHEEFTLDCRLLFMGDRYRQLLRAYPEVIHRLSREKPLPEIAAFLRESAEIAQYYVVAADAQTVGVTLRDEIFREPQPLTSLDCRLKIGRRGHYSMLPLPLSRLKALGRLVPLLQGNHSRAEVDQGLADLQDDDRRWATALLETLEAGGCLETGPAHDNYFLTSSARPRTSFVAHTSILVQTHGASIVTDPLIRPSLRAPREALDVTRLDLTAICLTHAHWDHCDVQSLLLFDKRVTIVVPRVHTPTIFNPPMVPMLRMLGFTDIREVDPWDRIHLGDVQMTLVPFHGEQDEPGAEIDHYTYVFQSDGLSVYGGVDSFRDTYGEMRASLARVREEHKPTVAFLPISQMVYAYRDGGVNGFCRYMDTSLLDQSFQYTAGPAEASEWVRELGVSTVVPYATFTFKPRATPGEVADFAQALDRAGLGTHLLPLPTLGAVELSDLDGSPRALRRRRSLRRWFTTGASASRLDRRLKQIPVYRFARRLVAGGESAVHHH